MPGNPDHFAIVGKEKTMKTISLQFKTIAVATDLSDASSAALEYAQSIARTYQSTLILVHVIDPLAYAFPDGAPAFLEANKAAREELDRIEEEARKQGIAIHSVVESGVVCERILQSVRGHNADLLVLGTRGKSEAGRVALGRIARQLLAKAQCPIMTISQDAAASTPWSGSCRSVLAATDFSSASITGLRFAHQIALRQLITLHVARDEDESGSWHCLEKLRFLAPFDESHSVPVEHIVVSGDAGERIAEYAEKYGADLVVLGSPVNELAEEDLHTSTVLQVISKVACPVLCVPFSMSTAPAEAQLTREAAAV
jgi:nucleotide-binding universal stress UspA family protein